MLHDKTWGKLTDAPCQYHTNSNVHLERTLHSNALAVWLNQ